MLLRERTRLWRGEALLGALWLFRALSKPLRLHKAYRSLLIHLIKKTDLFDRAYYLEANSDVLGDDAYPLRHYVAEGDRQGRSPMPLFDPVHYRAQVSGCTKRVNSLLHYAYIGRYRRYSPGPWFDIEYYLSTNKDVARAGYDPLYHFFKWGGLEGRSPCAQFDSAYYLATNPGVAEANVNPLLHYLLQGRLEGRQPLPSHPENGVEGQTTVPPLSINVDMFEGLTPRAGGGSVELDIIVPVYKGRTETLRCLHSAIAASGEIAFELVVIDDASPDPDLVKDLRLLADRKYFTLHANAVNRGFVHSVNIGMALHKDRDVVLLNSDTEVYDGWLERLRAAAYRHERTGTVSPLSNNATICSYPRFLHDNPFPLELSYRELDALTAEVNANVEAEAPTTVGFCMYIKRACLDSVGMFDEKTFGKGYGEENDFCQRAIRNRWRNVIAANVFVRHWGSTSFQGEKATRLHRALDILERRYPNYHDDVAQFIQRDPLLQARSRLDWARMLRLRREKNVLIVCHNRGGGTERHVQEDIQRLVGQDYGVFLLRPAPGKPTHGALSHYAIKSLPNTRPIALSDTKAFVGALKELGITEVHTHSLVDFAPDAPEHLMKVISALTARWELNIHDYKVICPRVNLADENGLYCGEPDARGCAKCLTERGSDFSVTDIRAWRRMHENVLAAATSVLVPDEDVAARLSRYYPAVHFEVSPHDDIDARTISVRKPLLLADEKLRVVVIGAIGKLKGFDVLLSCARHAREHNLPLEFVVMGYTMNDRLARDAGIRVTGKYQEQEAEETLRRLQPHAVWLPSLWPETYSYTLSLALHAQLQVFAFDIGAIATRLRRLDRANLLLPLSVATQPNDIIRFFLTQTMGVRCP